VPYARVREALLTVRNQFVSLVEAARRQTTSCTSLVDQLDEEAA
jgi:hypothetical protein